MADTATVERPGEVVTADDIADRDEVAAADIVDCEALEKEAEAAGEEVVETWVDQPPQANAPYLVFRHPGELLANKHNPRKDYGDLSDLKESMESVGLVQALTVIPDDNGLRILAGWRRATAASEVMEEGKWPPHLPHLVPCMVDPTRAGSTGEQVISMLVENDQRKALTPTERAKAYAQLALFGLDPTLIAKRVGRDVDTVKASLRLVKLGDRALKAADEGTLQLADSHRLGRFEADPEAMERLNRKLGNAWSLRHQLDEEERKLTVRQEEARLYQEMADAGVTVIKQPKGWPYECKAAAAASLRTADNEPIDVEAMKTQPGFAGFVYKENASASAIIVCEDPEAHGYKRSGWTKYKTPDKVAAEQEETRKLEQRHQLIVDAQDLRERFLIETWGNEKAAKPLVVEAMRQAVAHPGELTEGDEELIRGLAGGDILDVRAAGVGRLGRLLVAMWLAAEENNLDAAIRDVRCDRRGALAFLGRLVERGYGLSEVETEARERLAKWVAADDAEKARRAATAKARENGAATNADVKDDTEADES